MNLKVKILSFFLIPFISRFSFGQSSFPLKNQTWVFINGKNEETHIVQSITNFSPSKVITAYFTVDGRADLRFANLSGVFCRSTAEAIDSINEQLSKNFIPSIKIIPALSTFPDTSYSCDDALVKISRTGRFSKFMVNGKEISPTATETEWTWDLSLPTCYASHPASEVDKEEKDLCEGGWCSDPTPDPKDPYPEACDDAYTECRHYVDESLIKTKASEIQFWNLHIPAKIVMHPKHHSTGRIMKEVSMTEEEADAMRKVAIANPDEDKYKPYLNPVFDDSASVYFSGQFLAIAGAASSLSELNFDLQAKSDGASSYSHDPAKAYRIRTLGDKEGLQAALLMPFAKNDDEKEWLRNLDINCPGWQYNDTRIGERAFTIVDSVDATLPDVIPNSPTDEKWKTLRQEKVPLPSGGYFVRNFYDDARILKAQKSIVRNNKFLYSDYFWKGCPDLENLTFKYTKSQIAQFLNLPVPVCNLKSLIFSPALYRAFSGIFSNPNEKREKALADKRVQEAQFLYKRNSKRERPETYTCPETALDILLSRWK